MTAPLFAPAAYAPAFALIREGKYDQAVTKLKEAVAADPLVTDQALQSEDAKQGIAAFRKGDLRSATASLDAASKRYPQSAEVRRIHGMVLAVAKVHDGSLASLREAARMNPRDERVADRHRRRARRLGQTRCGARELARRPFARFPNPPRRNGKLGRVEQALGDAGAVRSFERPPPGRSSPASPGCMRSSARPITHSSISTGQPTPIGSACRSRRTIAMRTSISPRSIAAQDKLDEALVEVSRGGADRSAPARRRSACSVRLKPQRVATKKRSPCCAGR